MDVMDWHIYSDSTGKWHWEVVDDQQAVTARSSQAFVSRDACLADARKHGFLGTHTGPMDHAWDEPDEG